MARTARLGVAGGLFAAGLCAQDHTEPPVAETAEKVIDWFGGRYWLDWSGVTGDWGGVRTDLADAGIAFGGAYVFDWSGVWKGGLEHGSAYRSLLDADLSFDLETLLGMQGSELFASFVSEVGPDATTELVGDIQGFDNMDAPNFHVLYDLWFQARLGDSVRVKLGKMDANSEFAYLEEGTVFLQSTAGFPPTILAFPTYPDPAAGIVVHVGPRDGATGPFVAAGFFDGALQDGINTGGLGFGNFFSDGESDAWFMIAEGGYQWSAGRHQGKGRAFVGAWHGTGDATRFDGGIEDGTWGYYAMAEQKILREVPDDPDDGQGLAVMASWGEADEEVSDFQRTILFGATYTGAIPGRDQDVLGALVSFADLSDVPAAGYPENETAYELYYELRLTPALSLQPVLSYIVNPSGDPSIDNALVGTLRGVIAF